MKPPVLLLGSLALVLLVSACASVEPLCPADSTADLDLTISQISRPDVHSLAVGTEEVPRAIPYPTMRFVPTSYVEYALDIVNRTGAPVRVKQIRLSTPQVDRHHPQAVCSGVESMPAPIERTSRDLDKIIPAGGHGRVFMKVVAYAGDEMTTPAYVMKARLRLETEKGTHYEFLSRRVMPLEDVKSAEPVKGGER